MGQGAGDASGDPVGDALLVGVDGCGESGDGVAAFAGFEGVEALEVFGLAFLLRRGGRERGGQEGCDDQERGNEMEGAEFHFDLPRFWRDVQG